MLAVFVLLVFGMESITMITLIGDVFGNCFPRSVSFCRLICIYLNTYVLLKSTNAVSPHCWNNMTLICALFANKRTIVIGAILSPFRLVSRHTHTHIQLFVYLFIIAHCVRQYTTNIHCREMKSIQNLWLDGVAAHGPLRPHTIHFTLRTFSYAMQYIWIYCNLYVRYYLSSGVVLSENFLILKFEYTTYPCSEMCLLLQRNKLINA